MRILWLSHLIPYPPKGGVLQRSHLLIKGISKKHDVDLLAFNQLSLLAPLFHGNAQTGMQEAKKELLKICEHVDFLPIPSETSRWGKQINAFKSLFFSSYTMNWLKSIDMTKAIRKRIHEYNYDLIHFDTISLDIFKNEVKGIPCVLDHHNIESHMMLRRASMEVNPLKKAYFLIEGKKIANYEKLHCPSYSGHITCSQIDLERLLNLAPGITGRIIPNCVDTSYFKPKGFSTNGNTLIFIGTMNWYPNITAVRFIINDILPRLRKAKKDINIQIIGANPPQDIVKYSQDNTDFEVLGFVDDIRSYMENAAIYICPIMDGGGTKLKIIDALSMAKAIVAHPIACEGIDVVDRKNVVLAETAQEFSEQILHLLANKGTRSQLEESARKLAVEQYNYEKIGMELSSYYDQLVN